MEAEFSDMKPLNSSTIKQKSQTRGSVISQVKHKYIVTLIETNWHIYLF